MLDFGCMHVEFDKWMSEFDCVDVGFWLHGCLILVVWTLDFDWTDVLFCCENVGF